MFAQCKFMKVQTAGSQHGKTNHLSTSYHELKSGFSYSKAVVLASPGCASCLSRVRCKYPEPKGPLLQQIWQDSAIQPALALPRQLNTNLQLSLLPLGFPVRSLGTAAKSVRLHDGCGGEFQLVWLSKDLTVLKRASASRCHGPGYSPVDIPTSP